MNHPRKEVKGKRTPIHLRRKPAIDISISNYVSIKENIPAYKASNTPHCHPKSTSSKKNSQERRTSFENTLNPRSNSKNSTLNHFKKHSKQNHIINHTQDRLESTKPALFSNQKINHLLTFMQNVHINLQRERKLTEDSIRSIIDMSKDKLNTNKQLNLIANELQKICREIIKKILCQMRCNQAYQSAASKTHSPFQLQHILQNSQELKPQCFSDNDTGNYSTQFAANPLVPLQVNNNFISNGIPNEILPSKNITQSFICQDSYVGTYNCADVHQAHQVTLGCNDIITMKESARWSQAGSDCNNSSNDSKSSYLADPKLQIKMKGIPQNLKDKLHLNLKPIQERRKQRLK